MSAQRVTDAALRFLDSARRILVAPGYIALLEEAERVRRERKAPQLGRIHLEVALERLSTE